MNTKIRRALILTLALLAGVALVAVVWAAPGLAPLAGGTPTVVAYQGEVRVGGIPYNGAGYFKFAVVRHLGSTTYWSNDGTSTAGSPPTAAVPLAVDGGLFSVLLGDTTLDGMTQPLAASVFGAPDRYLRVWFSTSPGGPFDQLGPDTRIAAVPYALQAEEAVNADTVDGLHANELRTRYQNVVVVAKSGGDYTSVQAAIDSIGDAAAANAYLVWVAPGVYEEQVTMKPHVHLQGAGQEATIITSDANSGVWPPTAATVVLASDTSLRDLTVENSGAADNNQALLATAGTSDAVVADVTARSVDAGVSNHAIVVVGSPTRVILQRVAALAENGSSHNVGLVVSIGADAVLRGGTFTARGGVKAWAVFASMGAAVEAEGVSMLAENASDNNTAMYPYDGAEVVLRGGDYTARGGLQTNGVADQLNSTVTAYDVTALAENGTDNYGLGSFDGSSMTVRGATVTARGGSYCNAVGTSYNGSTLDAESVVGLAEDCSSVNYGLYVGADTAHATVRGGSFTGRGGEDARGIISEESNITLYAEGVTALGENGSDSNFGLSNDGGAEVTLLGGSFTGRGGTLARGIHNNGDDTMMNATGVNALGENGSTLSAGLANAYGAEVTLSGGSFTGRGTGSDSCGILNGHTATKVAAASVTALGEDGEYSTGLLNFGGAQATLNGGYFTGRWGTHTQGINNGESGTTLEADSITALGEDGSNTNVGLITRGDAEAMLSGGTYTGTGGPTATGMHVDGVLIAHRVTATGEDSGGDTGLYIESGFVEADSSQFAGSNSGLEMDDGSAYLGVTKVFGSIVKTGGTLTCFEVYDWIYTAISCP